MKNNQEKNLAPKEYVILEIKKQNNQINEVNKAINLERSTIKVSRYLELIIMVISILILLSMYSKKSLDHTFFNIAILILNLIFYKFFQILEDNSILKLELYESTKEIYMKTIFDLENYIKNIDDNISIEDVNVKLNELIIGRNDEYKCKR